jgi:hypothetical protein
VSESSESPAEATPVEGKSSGKGKRPVFGGCRVESGRNGLLGTKRVVDEQNVGVGDEMDAVADSGELLSAVDDDVGECALCKSEGEAAMGSALVWLFWNQRPDSCWPGESGTECCTLVRGDTNELAVLVQAELGVV